ARFGILDSLRFRRMARHPVRQRALPRLLAGREQRAKHVAHLLNVVAGVEHVPKTELVGLTLVVAAVLQEEQLQPAAEQLAKLRDLGRYDHAETETELRKLSAAHLRDRMPRGDVPDLVT